MTAPNVLPDSRLSHRPDLGCVMADWPLGDGTTVRLEMQPVFCANCGVFSGHVPRDGATFAFYQCEPCFAKYGPPAGVWVTGDDAFRRKLAAEMLEKYGRSLTAEELQRLADAGRLGSLELLARESPYKEYRGG